jgi:hypothetical protein
MTSPDLVNYQRGLDSINTQHHQAKNLGNIPFELIRWDLEYDRPVLSTPIVSLPSLSAIFAAQMWLKRPDFAFLKLSA